MIKLINTYDTCEDCFNRVCIMDMVVKDTPDGICIYCRKCTERHNFLEREAETRWVSFSKQALLPVPHHPQPFQVSPTHSLILLPTPSSLSRRPS